MPIFWTAKPNWYRDWLEEYFTRQACARAYAELVARLRDPRR
jgi:hypothetical protein